MTPNLTPKTAMNYKSILTGVLIALGAIGWISSSYTNSEMLYFRDSGTAKDTAHAAISPPAKKDTAGLIFIDNISYKPGQKYIVGYVGETVTDPLIFKITGADRQPMAGIAVDFQIIDNPSKAKDFSITQNAVTDSAGCVYPSFQAGSESGNYVLIAKTDKPTGKLPKITVKAFDKTWILFLLFGVLGGLGIFLYGMGVGASGLQKVAGDKMRIILGKLTRTPAMGVLLGTGVTAIVQSSSATAVMVIGFISASLMTLAQGLSVMLGAHIGTTLTVQLIAFNISDYALLMIGVGFIMTIATKRKLYIYIGEIVLGFGFIFFGMSVMSMALGPLKSLPVVSEQLMFFGKNPLLGILFAAIFTGIVQSSGATIGLAVVLANEGLLDLTVGLPLVLGANIGTTVTGLLASTGASVNGKRAALANMLFSVVGVIIMIPLIDPFNSMVIWMTTLFGSDSVARQIANSHMLFNILNAAVLVWFIGGMAKVVSRMIPEKKDGAEAEMRTIYLNNDLLEVPELAIEQSSREIHRMADKIAALFHDTRTLTVNYSEEAAERLTRDMNIVYFIESEIRKYYTRLSQKNISLFQSKRLMAFLLILDDLRRIAYILADNMNERLAQLKKQNGRFSAEGMKELDQYFSELYNIFVKTVEVVKTEKPELAQEVLEEKKHIKDRETELRESHIKRLNQGLQESIESSAVHLDIVSLLKRIDTYCNRINHSIIDQYNLYKKK